MELFYNIFDNEAHSINLVGGKGHSLMFTAKSGNNVPPGVIISAKFFEIWLEQIKSTSDWNLLIKDEIFIKEISKKLKETCYNLEYSDIQLKTINNVKNFLAKEEINVFAVRSSSPEEDLEGASFAGIYESVMGVTEANLDKAIRTCFSSCLDERVFAYKLKNKFDPLDPKIAVIIQQQVNSEISGVAFSLNPVSNDHDEVVINANFGLGITVVDGTVTPDQIIVDKVSNTIIEKIAGKKNIAAYLKADGGTEIKNLVDPTKLCLTDKQIITITSLVKQIETEYNKPMDIEWAYEGNDLYLLQARPITGYYKLPTELMTEPGEPRRLYHDVLLTEQGMVENISPLGMGIWDLIVFVMLDDKVIKNLTDLKYGVYCGVGGRVYLNFSNILTLPGKKTIINSVNLVDNLGWRILNNLNLKKYTPRKRPKGLLKSYMKLGFGMIQKPFRIIHALRKPKEYLKFYIEENINLEGRMKQFYQKNCLFEDCSFKTLSRELMKMSVKHMNQVAMPALYATMFSRSKIKKMFNEEPQNIQDQLIYLENSLPQNVTIEMGLNLYELSQFPEIINTDNPIKFIQNLKQSKLSTEFMEKWNKFMDRFGFRYPKEIDIATPRYREKPGEVFIMMKSLGSNINSDFNPIANFEKGVKRREKAVKILEVILEKKSKRKLKKFKSKYNVLKTLAAYREIPKYYLVMANHYIRLGTLALGKKWVNEGRLDAVEQIFDLKYSEVSQAEIDINLDIRDLAKNNHDYNAQFNTRLDPPVLIDSRGRILTPIEENIQENELLGAPASPGTVKGPVKILNHPDEKTIIPGDILVTKATDPGWTILFLNAAGILLESGGTLQHGASVARESGKPCIVGINHATKILKDGQIVEMNGSTGLIKIIQ
jgi:pyruvate,water dikinase